MDKLYLPQNEFDLLIPYCDDNSHQEATILDYSETEIIKHFHMLYENKVYTLEEIESQRENLELIKELLLFKKVVIVNPITKKIQICDLDSCKIGNNKPFETKYLQFFRTYSYVTNHLAHKYPKNTYIFIPNYNTDLYCYITIILKVLFNIDVLHSDLITFYSQIYALKSQGLPEPLFQIFMNIYNICDNKNLYKFLEFIPESFERNLKL